jgi:uncharacterized protein YraI
MILQQQVIAGRIDLPPKERGNKSMFKKTNQKLNVVIIFTVVAALLLSACGGTETPVPTQAAPTEAAVVTPAAPEPTQAAPTAAAPTQAAPPPGPTPDPNLPSAVFPTPAPGEPAAVANFNTTIYSGPGTNYVVYAAFLGSQTAKVVGKSEDSLWWAISVPVAVNGTGWVDAGWVTVSNADTVPVLPTPPVPSTTDLVPPAPEDPQLYTVVNTYVRSGPSNSYPAYGIAQTGAHARVLGKSEDGLWWVVRLDPAKVGDGHGWVEAQYTEEMNVEAVPVVAAPTAAQSAPPPPPPSGAPSATAQDYVNVRSGPGTNYAVLVVAPPGASGEVSGKSADGAWWQVKISTQYSPDGFGWVSADYVTTQNTDAVPVVEAPAPPPTVGTTPPPTTEGGCAIASQNPADGTVFGVSASFETTWLLQNTSSGAWTQGDYDFVYVGAVDNTKLHTGPDRYDLTANVDPGATYNFAVSMYAPFEMGTFGEAWSLMVGSQPVCTFYVYIEVK